MIWSEMIWSEMTMYKNGMKMFKCYDHTFYVRENLKLLITW